MAFSDQSGCMLVLMEVPVLPSPQVPSGQQLGLHQICPGLYSSQGKVWEYNGKKTGISWPLRGSGNLAGQDCGPIRLYTDLSFFRKAKGEIPEVAFMK